MHSTASTPPWEVVCTLYQYCPRSEFRHKFKRRSPQHKMAGVKENPANSAKATFYPIEQNIAEKF